MSQQVDPRWVPVDDQKVDPRWQPVEEPNFRADNAVGPDGKNVVVSSAPERFVSNFAKNVLPSTVPSDYIEGPMYAAQHPIDSISLVLKALWDAHAAQAGKTVESAKQVIGEPTLKGKLMAGSETLGHGLATILPAVGPAAANAGEQIGSGDIAGGLGAATGILTPNVVAGMRGTAPAKFVGGKLHDRAVEQYGQALNPTRKDTKVMTDRIVPKALNRRVKATNLQKLEELASDKSDIAGAKVGETYAPHLDDTTDTMALVEKLEEAKSEYRDTTVDGNTVNTVPERVDAIQKLQDKLMEYGDSISVKSRLKLRRNWDEIVNSAKGFVTEDVGVKAWAAREGRSVLRENLKESVPDIDAINADFSFWQSLEDVTHASNERKTGQKKNLMTTIAGGAGAIAAEVAFPGGGMVKGGLQALLGAQLFSSFRKLLDSPGYQMWSAVQKERLADALMDGDVPRVRGLVHQGFVSAGAGSRTAGRLQSGRPTPKAADAEDETGFDVWYARMAKEQDLNPDPDSQPYDYRAAFKAGAKPDSSGHWPSQFKKAGHPNEIVGGFNTRTGEPEPGHEQITDVQKLIELGWDPASAKAMVQKHLRAKGQADSRQSLRRGSPR